MFFWKKLCSCTYRTLQRICVYMKKNQSPRRLKNHNLICSDNLYIKIIIKFKVWNKNISRKKISHALSIYIHPSRMHSPCRAMAEIQLPRTPSSQMSSCFLPTLSVAKGYRFHTEHLLASFLSCFESGPSRTHRESNLCKKAGSHCPL